MGTIVRRADDEQNQLRRALIAEYRAWPFYEQHVAQRLRPLWQRLSERYDWGCATEFWSVEAFAEEQRLAEEDGGGPCDSDLAEYVDAVRETVGRHMGLTAGGTAAAWVLGYVQADAARERRHGWAPDPTHIAVWKWEQLGISLRVTEKYARLSVTRHDRTTEELPENSAALDSVFRGWEDLRQQAHEMIDREIDRIRHNFEHAYAERDGQYRGRYLGASDHREDIALLRALLTATPNRRRMIDRATRERLRRLCDPKKLHTIGIDLPRDSRTKVA